MLRPLVRGGAFRSHRSRVQRLRSACPGSRSARLESTQETGLRHAWNRSGRHESGVVAPSSEIYQIDAENSIPATIEEAVVNEKASSNYGPFDSENPESGRLEIWQDSDPQAGKGNVDKTESIPDRIVRSLKAKDSHDVLQILHHNAEGREYLRNAPPSIGIEILDAIDPAKFLDPFGEALQGTEYIQRYWDFEDMSLRTTSITGILRTLLTPLRQLVRHWRDVDRSLLGPSYRILMRIAGKTGDGILAEEVHQSIDDGDMDTETYNSYFAAKCFENARDPAEYRLLRVTPRSLFFRSSKFKPRHKTPYNGYRTGELGLASETTLLFNHMVKSGVVPDLNTFCMLMVAMGREGDIAGAEKILDRVWDVKVDEIMAAKTDSIYLENDLAPESLRFPNTDVLYTIAHVYGSNNQIAIAMRLIDYVSRKYSIEIDLRTWSELAGWTYVATIPRVGRLSPSEKRRERYEHQIQGCLPPETFENLWITMTGEPYRVEPTLMMHNMRIRSLIRTAEFSKTINAIREAVEIHGEKLGTREAQYRARAGIKRTEITLNQSHASQRRQVELLKQIRDGEIFESWLRLLLLESRSWKDVDKDQYQRLLIPRIIAEFESNWFSGPGICHRIRNGRVQFPRRRPAQPCLVSILSVPGHASLSGKPMKVVRPLSFPAGKPYMERTWSQRQTKKRLILMAHGYLSEAKYPPSWFETDIGNWIWTSNTEGYRSTSADDLEMLT